MSYTLDFPIQYISNPDRFATIGLGELYIGVVDGDPAFEPSDRIQAYIARQNDTDLAIPQPIELSAGGVPVYLGSPVTLKIDQEYSIAVLDKNGAQVYYSPKAGEIIEELAALAALIDELSAKSLFVIENVAALATFTPVTGQVYSLKEYHAGTGIGGGELIGKSGVVVPDNVNTFSSATPGVYFERINSQITFYKAGGHPSRTAAQNLAALKAMIAGTSAGGIATVEPSDGIFIIDCAGGLSAAADINKKMTLVVNGILASNFGTLQSNPPFLLKVSGSDVTIEGEGVLKGDGTVNDLNTGDETTFPGLLYVTGDRFTCKIKTIDTPPKVGIALYNCNNALISVERWLGGVVTYTVGNTAYFGVRILNGSGHKICGNDFSWSSTTGRFIDGIFSVGCDYLEINNNKSKTHEKLCYLYTSNSKIHNNFIRDGVRTDVIRVNGSSNEVYDNDGDMVKGGISLYDGAGNILAGNTFRRVQQIGIYLAKFVGSAYAGNLSNNVVKDNHVYADSGSATLTSGIEVVVDGASASEIDLSSNTCVGFGKLFDEGNIRVRAVAPYSITSSKIDNNFITGGLRAGIITDRVVNSSISDNRGKNITEYFLVEIGGAYNDFLDNAVKTVGSIGINGLSVSSNCSGNKYDDNPLISNVTLSALVTTTVVHAGVAPNARVFLQTGNNSAGVMIVTKGWPTTAVSGNNFTITMANGTAAAGTESFFYRIEQ